MTNQDKLMLANLIIDQLENDGVKVYKRIENEQWFVEENPYFFGCEFDAGAMVCDVDDIIDIRDKYYDEDEYPELYNVIKI